MKIAMDTEIQAVDPRLAERERVRRIVREHADRLRVLGVARLWLFGSFARGDAGRGSDIDVLIAVPPGRKFSLFDLGEVRVELCELLGREVDVVVEDDLVPAFRNDIGPDLVEVL